jgi:hypothetical protein
VVVGSAAVVRRAGGVPVASGDAVAMDPGAQSRARGGRAAAWTWARRWSARCGAQSSGCRQGNEQRQATLPRLASARLQPAGMWNVASSAHDSPQLVPRRRVSLILLPHTRHILSDAMRICGLDSRGRGEKDCMDDVCCHCRLSPRRPALRA